MLQAILLSNLILTHNFNNDNCELCTSAVNNITNHNSSVYQFLNETENYCQSLNFTDCVNITNQTKLFLDSINSYSFCEQIGLCSSLNMENYVDTCENITIFSHMNSVIGSTMNISTNNITFHKVWNITLPDEILNVSLFEFVNLAESKLTSCYKHNSVCNYNDLDHLRIIKLINLKDTYYFNVSNCFEPLFIEKITFDYNTRRNLPTHIYNYFSNLRNDILDIFYNDTIYLVKANYNFNNISLNIKNISINFD